MEELLNPMQKTTFKIAKMDCPSEEQMIRMKLGNIQTINSMEFDLHSRLLHVFHSDSTEQIFQHLDTLKLGTSIVSTQQVNNSVNEDNKVNEKKTLWTVLLINFIFFAIEIIAGLLSSSMGLIADSLDMLADSFVYALALIAVAATIVRKKSVAKFAGLFQIVLALVGFIEVIRRFAGMENMPDFKIMIFVSLTALIANAICLYLLQKNESNEAHIQASTIFTSNDIIINTGVILAGFLVNWLDSHYPDLIIGTVVFLIVARGAYRILQLSK